MRDFNKNFEQIMRWEIGSSNNGYVSDKDDNGGVTVFGITRKGHPNLKIWESLDNLKLIGEKRGYKPTDLEMNEIIRTYRKDYYDKMNLDRVIDDRVAHFLFDYAVNSGVSRSAKAVQQIVGVTADGIVGGQTINAINKTHSKSLLTALIKSRANFLNSIVVKNPSQKKFLKGWLRRCENCVDWIS